MGDEPETTQLEKVGSETKEQKNKGTKTARKIKGKTLPKSKINGLEREDSIRHEMSQIVAVTEIHQRTQILGKTHQYLKRKK